MCLSISQICFFLMILTTLNRRLFFINLTNIPFTICCKKVNKPINLIFLKKLQIVPKILDSCFVLKQARWCLA